jgi:Protein of unknown function (DUF1549)/Protein of unknown function (DUF1553)/Planctomycete cytochrome C
MLGGSSGSEPPLEFGWWGSLPLDPPYTLVSLPRPLSMPRLGTFTLALAAWCSTALSSPFDDARPVDFDSQIKPILQARCLNCHAKGKYKGGLSLETRESTLKGGESGPAVVPGKSGESLLVELVAGLDPDRRMPEKGDPLSKGEVALIRAWIDQGATWPESSGLGFRKAPLAPRNPAVPVTPGHRSLQPIDRFIARHQREKDVTAGTTTVPDRVFARRASLDLVGLIPAPEKLDAFEKDQHPDRHLKYVEALLNDRGAYADHWLTFWNDALRNAYRGAGFIDGGRATITRWLYKSLHENTPYDKFVHDLISPVPGSEGFAKGIVWRGVVNASQVPPVQAAQNVTQVFLGTNLKCASCHDSFVNHWKLNEAYALAAVFADKPLEISRCDQGTGKFATVGFLYPELGSIDPNLPKDERMKRLADLLVKPEDGRFARTIVNRLWAQLMGRGIVEPLDDMDQAAWDQDLLDWLAADFVAHGHDLKHSLAVIASSRAYRLRSRGLAEPGDRSVYAFRGPSTKRMTAEQFADAISTVTGVWPEVVDDMVRVDGRGQGGQLAAARAAVANENASGRTPQVQVEARWVWSRADAEHDPGGRILVRKVIKLDKLPKSALAVATCDNELVLYVNGKKVGQSVAWNKPVSADVTKLLKVGDNVIAAEATNWPDTKHNKGTNEKGPNPAAFLAWIGGFDGGKQTWGVGTDATWLWIEDAPGDWKTRSNTAGWKHVVELADADKIYGAHVNLTEAVSLAAPISDGATIRASLAFDDPLMSSLGRTSREQVVTRRDPIATTLQALELTNGGTLDGRLQKGAKRWIDEQGQGPEMLARKLFGVALGRPPTPAELAASRELIGTPATAEGLHDLMWAVTMLPEFQLIE